MIFKSANLLKPTAVVYINQNKAKSYGPPAMTHAKLENKLERDFQINKHRLLSRREN